MAETISGSFTTYIDGMKEASAAITFSGTLDFFLDPIPDALMDLFGEPRIGELDRWANDGGPA